MDKPRQQHERRAATVELIRSLENPARSASRNPEERAQLIRLIKEEQAVQQWADNAGAKSSNDQYRANMAVAKSNSQQVEATLRSALRLFKAGDLQEAAAQLHTVSTKGSRAGTPKVNLSKRYMEYLAYTDTEFHDWLRKQGHEEELQALGLKTEKRRPRFGPANDEEDY